VVMVSILSAGDVGQFQSAARGCALDVRTSMPLLGIGEAPRNSDPEVSTTAGIPHGEGPPMLDRGTPSVPPPLVPFGRR